MEKKVSCSGYSLMTKMFSSYFTLILIPFIFFSVLFASFASENMSKSVIVNTTHVIDIARASFDEKILSVQNLLFQLINTKNVADSLNVRNSYTPYDIYADSKCMSVFTIAITANPFCDEIFYYLPDNKTILTSTYKFYKDNAYDSSSVSKNKMVSLISLLEQQNQNLGVSHFYFDDNIGNTQLVILLTIRNTFGKIVSLGAFINQNELSELLNTIKLTSGMDTAILNDSGKLLETTEGSCFANSSAYKDVLGSMSAGNTIKLADGGILTYVSSEFLSVRLVSLIPAKSVSIMSRNIILLMIFIFLLLIVDCLILNYCMAKHIYKPVTAILKLINSPEDNRVSIRNDIGIISNTLKASMEKATTLENYVSNNLSHFREKFLWELITEPSLVMDTVSAQTTALKLQLRYKYFSIHICHIYNYKLYSSVYGNQQAGYARKQLLEMLKEINIPDVSYLFTVNDNRIIILLNMDDYFEAEKFENLCSQNYNNVNLNFYNEFGLEFCTAFGTYVEKITDVSKSYLSATDNIKNIIISTGINTVSICGQDKANVSNTCNYQYSFHDENFITDMLVCGKPDEAIERLHSIIEANFCCGTNFEYIKLLFTELLATAVRSVYESAYKLSDVYGHEYDIFANLNLYDKPDDIIDLIKREYLKIGAFMKSNINKSKIASYDLEKYISENYTKNIGLTDAAEYFGLSAPYFSKLFKSTMNCLFVDYLCRYRVQKALKLISESNKALKQIAIDTGFVNYKTFARSLFKITSMTPEQFRARGN